MKDKLRCAIYSRKSSEEGLDQDFNSLDAQREACLAYIQSQKGEGWTPVSRHYDDGGWSGGSMERPALGRLLADIEAGQVNIVVVYKVDRLTRSLSDFARIVDIFDRKGVSFVSVTQAFNTTSSMGRLTLNVLLSFAQFEREVTGERIRDKIAASKAKGMWMGGTPPLGYRPRERSLEIDPVEAETVRHIFNRYLELRSVHVLARELREAGIRSRKWTTAKGDLRGGAELRRGAIRHMLRNRIYLGEIVHHDKAYPGQHAAIIDRETFDTVAGLLDGGVRHRTIQTQTAAPLTGLLFDAAGNRMTPTHSQGRSGRRYAYYVSAPLQTGGDVPADIPRRVSALQIEGLLLENLRLWSARPVSDWSYFLASIRRIELHRSVLQLAIVPPAHEHWQEQVTAPDEVRRMADGALHITLAATLARRGGRSVIDGCAAGRARANPDRTLISGLRRAHATLAASGINLLDRHHDFANASGIDDPWHRAQSTLAFLAPDIQAAFLTGHQPRGMTLTDFMKSDIPLCWNEQRRMLGRE
jgi:DNA invertase Pin-like site-specific DNA recombinase